MSPPASLKSDYLLDLQVDCRCICWIYAVPFQVHLSLREGLRVNVNSTFVQLPHLLTQNGAMRVNIKRACVKECIVSVLVSLSVKLTRAKNRRSRVTKPPQNSYSASV